MGNRRDQHIRGALEYSLPVLTAVPLIDGIKFYPHDGGRAWVLVLPEKERPYCTVLTDAATQPEAESLSKEYAGLVEEWRTAVE